VVAVVVVVVVVALVVVAAVVVVMVAAAAVVVVVMALMVLLVPLVLVLVLVLVLALVLVLVLVLLVLLLVLQVMVGYSVWLLTRTFTVNLPRHLTSPTSHHAVLSSLVGEIFDCDFNQQVHQLARSLAACVPHTGAVIRCCVMRY
jgi:hypothetical protein